MEKKNSQKFTKRSVPCRIPKHVLLELSKIGNGDWKQGLSKAIDAHNIINKEPEIKLMHDVELLMTDLSTYYSNNHYEHFNNFPACFRQFLKQGHLNWSKINKRYEKKPIDEFEKETD